MDQIFPKISICELNGHTPFGQLQVHPMLCQLPANATNAYLFLNYWTWLVAVFIINVWSILELLIHALPGCRTYNYTKNERVVTLHSFGFGDWLLMNFIKKNISDYMFRSLLKSLQKNQIGEADKSCDSDDDLSCESRKRKRNPEEEEEEIFKGYSLPDRYLVDIRKGAGQNFRK
ncbi:hypothetical protein HA402_009907 [Bradysia odoriphaga]|nr:hypothetical protein HA402_009907 [Bradysia odoriphaga]